MGAAKAYSLPDKATIRICNCGFIVFGRKVYPDMSPLFGSIAGNFIARHPEIRKDIEYHFKTLLPLVQGCGFNAPASWQEIEAVAKQHTPNDQKAI